jgi:hypothetical protein
MNRIFRCDSCSSKERPCVLFFCNADGKEDFPCVCVIDGEDIAMWEEVKDCNVDISNSNFL